MSPHMDTYDILQSSGGDTNHCDYEPHNPDSGQSHLRSQVRGCAQMKKTFQWVCPFQTYDCDQHILVAVFGINIWVVIDDPSLTPNVWLADCCYWNLAAQLSALKFELTTGLCPRLSLSLLGGYCVLWLVWLHHRPQAAQLRPCSVGPAAWAGEHDDSGEMLRDVKRWWESVRCVPRPVTRPHSRAAAIDDGLLGWRRDTGHWRGDGRCQTGSECMTCWQMALVGQHI